MIYCYMIYSYMIYCYMRYCYMIYESANEEAPTNPNVQFRCCKFIDTYVSPLITVSINSSIQLLSVVFTHVNVFCTFNGIIHIFQENGFQFTFRPTYV